MITKNTFENFIETITKSNVELTDLINQEKIYENINQIKYDLNILNFIITMDKKQFYKNIEIIWEKNQNSFKILPILVALRLDWKGMLNINGIDKDVNHLINSLDDVYNFFEKTSLEKFILDGKIKNFLDYLTGIEVGLDVNARKNRNGKKNESTLEELIKFKFAKYSYIKICTQIRKYDKLFDIFIENTETKQIFYLESSFYNTNGSKINETLRSYLRLNTKININTENDNDHFIWIVDGKGILQNRKLFEENYDANFIYNLSEIEKKIKTLVLKNKKIINIK